MSMQSTFNRFCSCCFIFSHLPNNTNSNFLAKFSRNNDALQVEGVVARISRPACKHTMGS